MPIFEFACSTCGYRFEKLERSGDAAEIKCPACGSHDVKKQFSSFATGPSDNCSTSSGGG